MDKQKELYHNICDKLNKMIAESKNGEVKITAFGFGEFGGMYARTMLVKAAEITSYAQYDTALNIVYRKPRCRTYYRARYYGSSNFALFEGDWDIPTEAQNIRHENGMIITEFVCFDKKDLYKAIDVLEQKIGAVKIGEVTERIFAEERAAKEKTYVVVGLDNEHHFMERVYDTEAELLADFELTGRHHSTVTRTELEGTPKLNGLIGAMYDGERNGKAVIRYETAEVYEILSA